MALPALKSLIRLELTRIRNSRLYLQRPYLLQERPPPSGHPTVDTRGFLGKLPLPISCMSLSGAPPDESVQGTNADQ